MGAVAARVAQAAGVRHNIPGEDERHVRVAHQSVALVPHVIFGVRTVQLESCRVTGPAFESRIFRQRNVINIFGEKIYYLIDVKYTTSGGGVITSGRIEKRENIGALNDCVP